MRVDSTDSFYTLAPDGFLTGQIAEFCKSQNYSQQVQQNFAQIQFLTP